MPGDELANMRVAIVHEWFETVAGSERVVEQLLKILPQADVFTLVDYLGETEREFLSGHKVTTSFIQRLPFARKKFRAYLPLMPIAIEQFDLSGYDVVISSNHAVAKGVITGPDQLHISYVHTPIRYAWDLQHQYLREGRLDRGFKAIVARMILHYMRMWDVRTAHGVDAFVANSEYIARRIGKVYGRPANVIYPPVNLQQFTLSRDKEDFYLAASRMVPYKRIPLIAQAFAEMRDKQLVIIGDGPEMARVRGLADSRENIQVMGYQPDSVLKEYMARARALVFAAEEDFGIMPVEAQACGTPVVAYGKGGALETVVSNQGLEFDTGLHFYQQTVEAIINVVGDFEAHGPFRPEACRSNALRFSQEQFGTNMKRLLTQYIASEASHFAATASQ